jgi:hypothetical protein
LASADHDQHLRLARHETTGEAGGMRQQKTPAARPRGSFCPRESVDGLAEICVAIVPKWLIVICYRQDW